MTSSTLSSPALAGAERHSTRVRVLFAALLALLLTFGALILEVADAGAGADPVPFLWAGLCTVILGLPLLLVRRRRDDEEEPSGR